MKVIKFFIVFLIAGCGGTTTIDSTIDSTIFSAGVAVDSQPQILSTDPITDEFKVITFDNIGQKVSNYNDLTISENDLSYSVFDAYYTSNDSSGDFADLSTGTDSSSFRFRVNLAANDDNERVFFKINQELENISKIEFLAARYGETNQYREADPISTLTLQKCATIDGVYQNVEAHELQFKVENPGLLTYQINSTESYFYRFIATSSTSATTRFLIDTVKIYN